MWFNSAHTGAKTILAGLLAGLLCACAQHPLSTPGLSRMAPLQHGDEPLAAESAAASVETPDMLALNDEMREFVDRYAAGGSRYQRLLSLHSSLRSRAMLGIEYDPGAGGSARQVFQRGSANCLSYAHLFVSMARYAGLDARYLSLSLRPEWSRHGDRVALRQHVNVMVDLANGARYMVDIDPIARERVAEADVLKDREALALHHANEAMDALLAKDYRSAYSRAARSIDLAGDIDYLWVNLGAIYRKAGQNEAARQSYLTALGLNPDSRSAMNNLAVVYDAEGDVERSNYWIAQVVDHRRKNPYYHIWLGEQALVEGNVGGAINHYEQAIVLKSTDSEFYFRLARVYRDLNEYPRSIEYVERAIEFSRLVGERERYQAFLKDLLAPTIATRGD